MIVPDEKSHFYRLCGTSMYSKVLGLWEISVRSKQCKGAQGIPVPGSTRDTSVRGSTTDISVRGNTMVTVYKREYQCEGLRKGNLSGERKRYQC